MHLTFEMLPDAFSQMFCKIENIERLLQQQATSSTPQSDDLLSIEQAAGFLKLSVPTVYGLVSKRLVPCMKKSKRLYFSKNELSEYIKAGRKKTTLEIARETDDYLSNTKKNRAI